MGFFNRRYIPYYIVGGLIIILSLVIVIILTAFDAYRPEPETTTREITTEDRGNFPYYPDVPASAFDTKYFTTENGRVIYTDEAVKYYTGVDVSTFQSTQSKALA